VEGALKACSVEEVEDDGVDRFETAADMLSVGSAITVPAVSSFARKESK
jgi:hypothetical protein